MDCNAADDDIAKAMIASLPQKGTSNAFCSPINLDKYFQKKNLDK